MPSQLATRDHPHDYVGRTKPSWVLSLSTAFAATCLAVLAATAMAPGCIGTCDSAFDCPDTHHCDLGLGQCMSFCETAEDCLRPPECIESDPTNCPPRGRICKDGGRCQGRALVIPAGGLPFQDLDPLPDVIPGLDAPHTDGLAFIMDHFGIADRDQGFNIDGECQGTACDDNSMHNLGGLGNDDIQRGVDSGESLLLVQFAGLDQSFVGDQNVFTIRLYTGIDHNPIAADNFAPPPNSTECCEFDISSESLDGNRPKASYPAIGGEQGRFVSLAPVTVSLSFPMGNQRPFPRLTIAHSMIRGRGGDLSSIEDGVIGGAVTVNSLARADNPYCGQADARCPRQLAESSLLELLIAMVQPFPDIDLDLPPDGIESFSSDVRTGRIAECRDGCRGCVGPVVPPSDKARPWSCAEDQRIADGFSIGLFFTAVPATIRGTTN